MWWPNFFLEFTIRKLSLGKYLKSPLLFFFILQSKKPPGKGRALDCGAGIGRISKYLLLERFEKVDLVEQNVAFLGQASTFIGANKHLGNLFCSGKWLYSIQKIHFD